MDYKDLVNQISNNNICNIYFFYGEEQYLIKHYTNQLKKIVMQNSMLELNFSILEDSAASVSNIIEFCDLYPVMSEKKLLIVNNCEYFKGKKTNDIDELIEYLSSIPEHAYIIFIQDDFDKKSSLYKFMQNTVCSVEFKKLDDNHLVKWCAKQIKEDKKEIDLKGAQYLIEILEGDMQKIKNECSKLVGFTGNRNTITIEDVKSICKKTLKYEVFEMVDNISQRNIKDAIVQLGEILNSKESEIKILGLIIWNIKTLLRVKLALEEGLPANLISKKLGIGFINKYLNQVKNFSIKKLQDAIILCSNADIEMKTTPLDNKIILEKLIIQIVD